MCSTSTRYLNHLSYDITHLTCMMRILDKHVFKSQLLDIWLGVQQLANAVIPVLTSNTSFYYYLRLFEALTEVVPTSGSNVPASRANGSQIGTMQWKRVIMWLSGWFYRTISITSASVNDKADPACENWFLRYSTQKTCRLTWLFGDRLTSETREKCHQWSWICIFVTIKNVYITKTTCTC